jgi:hypothetical protein
MAQKIRMWSELKQRLLAKRAPHENFLHSENYFLIIMGIISHRLIQYWIWGGTNHEIKIDELLETWENQRQQSNPLNQMDMPFRDKLIKQASWSSEKGVWEWPDMRDLSKSTSDTWERVIADNQIIGQNH